MGLYPTKVGLMEEALLVSLVASEPRNTSGPEYTIHQK